MFFNAPNKSVLAVVTNYGFSAAADDQKAELGKHFDTILIDSSSPTPPVEADIVIPNRYYPGLWNSAVEATLAGHYEWLLFVASDIQISNFGELAGFIKSACAQRYIGLYTPSLTLDSRLAFPACFSRNTGTLRECFICEGFFFLVRTKIVSRLYPVDQLINVYGWGIDVFTAYTTYLMGYRAVVDDRVQIHHPAAIHDISIEDAEAQAARYKTPGAHRFATWSNSQLRHRQKNEQRFAEMGAKIAHARWRMREWLR